MRIVVISDTHLETPDGLPPEVLGQMEQSDLVVHCGDFVRPSVLHFLSARFKLEAVQGNMDSAEIRSELPRQRILEIEGKKVGIVHGWGSPFHLAERVIKELPPVDIVLFGHSHVPLQHSIGATYVFNPGTLSAFALKLKRTYGILEVGPGRIHGVIRPV